MDDLLRGLLVLRRRPGDPLSGQLARQLRDLITSGRLAPGQRLPSGRALAQGLRIARNTAVEAIAQLVGEGYLIAARGRRPEVAAGAAPMPGRATRPPAGAARLRLSRWARGLAGSAWPPAGEPCLRAFQPCLADEREFPHAAWGRCLRRAAGRAARRDRQSLNLPELQQALLAHLADHRGIAAAPHQVFLLPSAQAGLAVIARVLVEPGDRAWVESPGYGGAVAALRAAGAAVVGIPVDRDGLTLPAGRPPPRILFVTPSHQFPTGHLMPVSRRLALLRFAEAAGAAVIEDDYDGEFHFEARPVTALAGLTASPRVLYVGTFSKAMVADVRTGYVVVPDALVEPFALAQRHMGLFAPLVLQAALAGFIAGGDYGAHVRRMTRLYRERRDRLAAALTAATDGRLAIEVPAGGMQLLARCAPGLDDVALARRLRAAGVAARPLSTMLFHHSRERGLLLGFSSWNAAEIDAAAAVVGRCLGAPARAV